jgi:hypothetical protein
MMNLGRPPLPLKRLYCRSFNYLEYVKDFDPNARVRVFKVAIRANDEIEDVEIINFFSFTFRNTMFDRCNNYMGDYPNYTFAELKLVFYKRFKMVQNDEQVYL